MIRSQILTAIAFALAACSQTPAMLTGASADQRPLHQQFIEFCQQC